MASFDNVVSLQIFRFVSLNGGILESLQCHDVILYKSYI